MSWWGLVTAVLLTHALTGSAEEQWQGVLTGLDLTRSHAFENADPALLEAVYPQGSDLLGRDRALLSSYTERGIDILDMRMQIISTRLVDRARSRVSLEVVDRLSLTRVRMPDGTVRDLPRDGATRRIIEMSFADDRWRISSVRQR